MDRLHLDYPFAGARMLRDLLRRQGLAVGRARVTQLMRKMGMEAVYRKANTSRRNLAHKVYPYLLRNLAVDWGQSGLGHGHHVLADETRLSVSGCCDRLA